MSKILEINRDELEAFQNYCHSGWLEYYNSVNKESADEIIEKYGKDSSSYLYKVQTPRGVKNLVVAMKGGFKQVRAELQNQMSIHKSEDLLSWVSDLLDEKKIEKMDQEGKNNSAGKTISFINYACRVLGTAPEDYDRLELNSGEEAPQKITSNTSLDDSEDCLFEYNANKSKNDKTISESVFKSTENDMNIRNLITIASFQSSNKRKKEMLNQIFELGQERFNNGDKITGLRTMINAYYMSDTNSDDKKHYLSELYSLRKNGSKKDNLIVMKIIEDIGVGDENLQALAKKDTLFSRPTKAVQQQFNEKTRWYEKYADSKRDL